MTLETFFRKTVSPSGYVVHIWTLKDEVRFFIHPHGKDNQVLNFSVKGDIVTEQPSFSEG